MFSTCKLPRYALALVVAAAAATIAIAPASAVAGTHANSGAYSVALGNGSQGTTVSPDDTPWG